jgi:MOSC domain-containing protein YiiM
MRQGRGPKSGSEKQGRAMKLLSIHVARPRIFIAEGQRFSTGIFKQPVEGPWMLRRLNLDRDRQADLRVHGGPSKAAYVYPSEHYPLWRKELPDMDLQYGMFGENFTTEGLQEDNTNIGDGLRIGGAVVVVTQPREPCFQLAAKFGCDDIIKKFLESGRSGFYLAVVEEGLVEAGQVIERIYQDENGVTVADMNRLYLGGAGDVAPVRRAFGVEALPVGYRDTLLQELQSLER